LPTRQLCAASAAPREDAEAAIGRGDDALTVADGRYRLLDAPRHHFRVLDEIRGPLQNARNEDHILGERHAPERCVFVGMPRIEKFDRQRADFGPVQSGVVLDWFSRRVLSWRVSITMEAAFRVETLEDTLARYGKPDVFDTDQGSQFTGQTFTGALAGNGIAISMDGKGAWRDNVFVERLWRSVKYEEVYLRAYDSVSEARASIGRYFDFYNGRRPHASLDGNTPDQAYFNPLPIRMAA
jgi:transposase InsO family protein